VENKNSVGKCIQQQPTTGNIDMTPETGNNYITRILTNSVEIPTPNSGFSMMTSSIKDQPNYCDNDTINKPLNKCKIGGQNVYIAISGCRSLSQSPGVNFFSLGMVENPRFAVGILEVYGRWVGQNSGPIFSRLWTKVHFGVGRP